MSSLPLPIAHGRAIAAESPMPFPGAVGFYFVFRVCLTFLFFQSNPVAGTIASILIDLALLYGAVMYTASSKVHPGHSLLQISPLCWIFALLAFSLISVLWTGAESVVAALAYWVGMATDIAIVLLLVRPGDAQRPVEAIMKGFVWGAVAVGLVAWCSPAAEDLRLGNDLYLHPNTLGLEIALATLIAQYLAQRGTLWKWLGTALAITLLRTLSKTAIIAFLIAEFWYLTRNNALSRQAKLRIAAGAVVVVISFWGLLTAYIDIYNNLGKGDQAETLTGRTVLWTAALAMSIEKPWFGHGLYSFKTLIPAFGLFEPVHAHNELIQQFFEFGIVGVAIAVGVFRVFYRHVRCAPPSPLRTLALTLLIFSLLRGLTDTVPMGLSYPLWLMTALSLCLAQPTPAEAYSS